MSRAVAADAVREPGPVTPSRARIVYVLGIAPLVALAVVSIVTFVDGLNPGSIGFDFTGRLSAGGGGRSRR